MSTKEEQAKQKYMELQLLMQHVQELNQQIERAQEQFAQTTALKTYIEDFANAKKGDRVYAGVGPGMFVEASLEETGKVLVNIGANVAVYKSLSDTKNLVEKQTKDLQEVMEKMAVEMQKLTQRSESLQEELKTLVQ